MRAARVYNALQQGGVATIGECRSLMQATRAIKFLLSLPSEQSTAKNARNDLHEHAHSYNMDLTTELLIAAADVAIALLVAVSLPADVERASS